jgi:hypothetical protein
MGQATEGGSAGRYVPLVAVGPQHREDERPANAFPSRHGPEAVRERWREALRGWRRVRKDAVEPDRRVRPRRFDLRARAGGGAVRGPPVPRGGGHAVDEVRSRGHPGGRRRAGGGGGIVRRHGLVLPGNGRRGLNRLGGRGLRVGRGRRFGRGRVGRACRVGGRRDARVGRPDPVLGERGERGRERGADDEEEGAEKDCGQPRTSACHVRLPGSKTSPGSYRAPFSGPPPEGRAGTSLLAGSPRTRGS